jgi:hypothetical protein
VTEVTLYPSHPAKWLRRGYLLTFGLRMRVRSAISTLASWSCSCCASLSSDRIGLSWSESFAATALAHSSRILSSEVWSTA